MDAKKVCLAHGINFKVEKDATDRPYKKKAKIMEKATPVHIRQSLELADYLKRAGIRFVPIPVFDEEDWIEQTKEFKRRVEQMTETIRN